MRLCGRARSCIFAALSSAIEEADEDGVRLFKDGLLLEFLLEVFFPSVGRSNGCEWDRKNDVTCCIVAGIGGSLLWRFGQGK